MEQRASVLLVFRAVVAGANLDRGMQYVHKFNKQRWVSFNVFYILLQHLYVFVFLCLFILSLFLTLGMFSSLSCNDITICYNKDKLSLNIFCNY